MASSFDKFLLMFLKLKTLNTFWKQWNLSKIWIDFNCFEIVLIYFAPSPQTINFCLKSKYL